MQRNGSFPLVEWPDIEIAPEDLVYMFEGNDHAVADEGHSGCPTGLTTHDET